MSAFHLEFKKGGVMIIFEKVKGILFKLSNKIVRIKNNRIKKRIKNLDSKVELFLEQYVENEMLSLRNFVIPNGDKSIAKNHFLLFNYDKHLPKTGYSNLGDYIQTIATKNALLSLNPKATFEYFDRDSLISYYPAGGGANSSLNALTPVVMQGWFAFSDSPHFVPNHFLLPIFVGTHFTSAIHKFLQYFIVYYPWYFEGKTIGCRDLETLRFCEKLGLESYLSRCLTLTLPKRTQEGAKQATKVFLVGIPEDLLKFIPQHLREGAISINQQRVSNEQSSLGQSFYQRSEDLLETYKREAKLIITCALHCAAPCVAMGIPVVLIAMNEENKQRFSAVSGILRIWTLEELKAGLVDFNPKSLDIESLKKDMLENLRLSIQKEMGEKVEEEKLLQIRERIAEFKIEDRVENSDEIRGGDKF